MTKSIIALLLAVLWSQAPSVGIVNGSARMKRVPIMIDGKLADADIREEQVSISSQNGKSTRGILTLLHEPRTKAFWWQYQPINSERARTVEANSLDNVVIYVAGGRALGFSFSRPFLWIRESSEHFANVDEGQTAALAELSKKAAQIEAGSETWGRAINIGRSLGSDFLNLKGDASGYPEPKLREVKRKDGEWHVILDGPNKDTADVILNDEYQVLGVNREPQL